MAADAVEPGGDRARWAWAKRWLEPALLALTAAALLAGGVSWWAGNHDAAHVCWAAGTVIAIVPSIVWVVAALRRGHAGVDVIATLALAGTLAVGEYLAGALIALMLASGRTLDVAAERRASRDLRALLEHAPRTARRRVRDQVEQVPLDAVETGDVLLVGPGEVVPVDGLVIGARAVLDESALTGEPLPVEYGPAEPIRSGTVNAGAVFELSASATARQSTYAEIVRLAEQAGSERAPMVRLAERYAAWFLPLSLLIAGLSWLIGGSAVRAVAVLVVATPCPLLLAAPVAIVSGLSRASRLGVIVRDGAALERLGRARTLVLDKTGTVTAGRPRVIETAAAPGFAPGEVLGLAASVDQVSAHVLAQAIVREARRRKERIELPDRVIEEPGRGTTGDLGGREISVGRIETPTAELPPWARAVDNRALLDGATAVWVTVDRTLAGAVLLRDPPRPDAPHTLRRLRAAGFTRLVMLTGDRAEPAREVGALLGLDEVRSRQSPADKVAAVREESDRAVTVMVGDGLNDAPALAAAQVGVAMGARGSTAASEAADVVLTTDHVARLADAMDAAVRSRRIAVQSAAGGMALSLVAMLVASVGYLPAAPGALLQEGIDVVVILNALRALVPGRAAGRPLTGTAEELVHRFAAEHEGLTDAIDSVREAAGVLAAGDAERALDAVREVDRLLTEQILPHEHAEEHQLYPALAAHLGGPEATETMSRSHIEIDRLARRIATHLELADQHGALRPEQIDDLSACLYGLHAVLRLHNSQEEESYFSLSS
ncbi:MAG TPA: heavy metal translocating P-type ATPase [Actinospica sp.]|nr:heavy metal translocating P-type ATPase [Actinospica sp.]